MQRQSCAPAWRGCGKARVAWGRARQLGSSSREEQGPQAASSAAILGRWHCLRQAVCRTRHNRKRGTIVEAPHEHGAILVGAVGELDPGRGRRRRRWRRQRASGALSGLHASCCACSEDDSHDGVGAHGQTEGRGSGGRELRVDSVRLKLGSAQVGIAIPGVVQHFGAINGQAAHVVRKQTEEHRPWAHYRSGGHEDPPSELQRGTRRGEGRRVGVGRQTASRLSAAACTPCMEQLQAGQLQQSRGTFASKYW